MFRRLRIDPLADGVQILDATTFVARWRASHGDPPEPFDSGNRGFDPTVPTLLGQVHDDGSLQRLKLALLAWYPAGHSVSIVFPAHGATSGRVETVSVAELAAADPTDRVVCIYVPAIERLADGPSFDTLRYIVARLRAPAGCPWDREQTHQSMKKHFVEETYEAIAALDEGDWGKFAEELGDVLLQVVMHAQLGREAQTFDLEDVLRAVDEKLIRRHPHVFGEVVVGSSADVLRNWEKIKRGETGESRSSFATIPRSIPALMRADAVQSRASRYGWTPPAALPDVADLERPGITPDDFRRALGNALFDLVAAARRHEVDPEEALRVATDQFATLLDQTLASLQGADATLDQLSPAERQARIRQTPPATVFRSRAAGTTRAARTSLPHSGSVQRPRGMNSA